MLYLRSVEDSDALRERLDHGGRVVVVGAGWIGAEVAASARQRGLDVTVLDPPSVPLERVLGTEIGAVYRDVHADHGVQMLMGTGVEALRGRRRRRARAHQRRPASSDCDFVVVGVGVQPRTQLAAQAGLAVGDGILVDEHLQTSAPGVFAAGDVAGAEHPFYGERDPRRALGQRAAPGPGGRAQHARPRARPTTACPTSSPTSTTSAWSTPGSPATGTGSCSAAISPRASSSPSGWSRTASWRDERQRVGRRRPDPAT